jgi:hypothetical protein
VSEWVTLPNPAAGQGWSTTVPDGEEWLLLGGGCTFDADATVATRVPGLVCTCEGIVVWAYMNVHNGTASGPTSNLTRPVFYYPASGKLPNLWSGTQGYPVGLPSVRLPGGTVIEGVFDDMVAGDQVTDIGLLVETSEVVEPPIQPVSGTFGFALRFN